MSLWSSLQRLFGGRSSTYALVWRDHTAQGTLMKGERIAANTDAGAISDVRAKFMHRGSDWTFWVLFRPNDTMVTAEQGPKIGKWLGDFAHVATESHVVSTLQSVRRHSTPVTRPLHRIKLKSRGSQE